MELCREWICGLFTFPSLRSTVLTYSSRRSHRVFNMKITDHILFFLASLAAAVPLAEHGFRPALETHQGYNRHSPKHYIKMIDERLQGISTQVAAVAATSSKTGGAPKFPGGMSPAEYLTEVFKSMEQKINRALSHFHEMANDGNLEPEPQPPMLTSINPVQPLVTAAAAATSTMPSIGLNDTSSMAAVTSAPVANDGMNDQTQTTGLFLKRHPKFANTSTTPFFGVLPPASTFPMSSPNKYITTFMPIPISSPTTISSAAVPTSSLSAAEVEEVQKALSWFFNFLEGFLPGYFSSNSGSTQTIERHGHRDY